MGERQVSASPSTRPRAGTTRCWWSSTTLPKELPVAAPNSLHGGVRYLKQGNISLVLEALRERGLLCENAPHLVHHLEFIVPIYSWWEGPFYGIGMTIYDRLAGKLGLSPSRVLSREETLKQIPTLEPAGLQRGVSYYDGQFDDSRLA